MIQLIFIISLTVLFLHVCTWEGMIFGSIGKLLKSLPNYIRKPLYDCPICMSVWWGSIILYIGTITDAWYQPKLFEWILIVFSAGGINTVLIYVVDAGKALTKVLNESDCNCTKKLTEEEKSEKRKKRISNFKGIDPLSIID